MTKSGWNTFLAYYFICSFPVIVFLLWSFNSRIKMPAASTEQQKIGQEEPAKKPIKKPTRFEDFDFSNDPNVLEV